MLQETERQFKVTVVAKSGSYGLEYWVVLLNDQYAEDPLLLDTVGKLSIFNSRNIETTVTEAMLWGKFLGVEVDLSSVESARNAIAAQPKEDLKAKVVSSSTTSSFGSFKRRANHTYIAGCEK